jgi:phenylacetate-CoA ligase
MQADKKAQAISAFEKFLNTPLEAQLHQGDRADLENCVLSLFRSLSTNVPAYRAFLREHQIEPDSIQTLADFQSLPLTTKANYIQGYPLNELCRHGKLESCDMVAVSSGSTGKPTFWTRFISDEFQIATRFEQIFHDSFQSDRHSTLAVVCFSLGTWIGGMYSASCCRHLAAKGYPITVVTPGNNQTEIFRVVRELAPYFQQTVLLGYPPFLKDIIDRGISEGINWQQYQIKLVMAGEVFSEEWRNLVAERIGSTNPCFDFASLYGTADAGVLANETPLSICIRRFFADRPEAARELFGESRLPTLVQYDPFSRFFETDRGTLLFSGDNGIPLIRYHIADTGGLLSYDRLLQFLQDWGFNPLNKLNYSENKIIRPLPFVYVFGRSQFTVSYFGANIYPENIAVGLEQADIRDWVTGKFVMEVKEDEDKNRFLAIAVELAANIETSQQKQQAIANSILQQLLRLNSEFANYVPQQYQQPQITLLPLGDPNYFPIGVKHRYVRSSI